VDSQDTPSRSGGLRVFARESSDPQAPLIDLGAGRGCTLGYGLLADECIVLTARLWEAVCAVPCGLRGVCSAWERLDIVLYAVGQAIDARCARGDLEVFLPTGGGSRIRQLRAVRSAGHLTIGFPAEL
jgi:hypothetical protein